MRARTLVALGLMMVGFAVAPATSAAVTGGAGMPSDTPKPKKKAARRSADRPGDTASKTRDRAGGAAFGSIPRMLRPTVPGSVGVIRSGVAYAPALAPLPVKRAIWAANKLRKKPYIYGGGHASFRSRGYDCSGTISFALHAAGVLDSPLDSGSFMRWGERGRGEWITVYTNPGHAYVVIAGMRLDTSGPGESGPRWREEPRSPRGFRARHPESL